MHTKSKYVVRTARALLQPEFLLLYVGMLLAAVVVIFSSQNLGVQRDSGDDLLSTPDRVTEQVRGAEAVIPAAVPPADSSRVEETLRPWLSNRTPSPSQKESIVPDHS